MRPWTRRNEKPAASTNWTAPLTSQTTERPLKAPRWADTGGWRSRTPRPIPPPPASSHRSSATAYRPASASPRPSLARSGCSTRALPVAAQGTPTACRPTYTRRMTSAAQKRAASPSTSRSPSPSRTAAAWAALSSPCRCAPTHRQQSYITTPSLHTPTIRMDPSAVPSIPLTPSAGGLCSIQPTANSVSHSHSQKSHSLG